MKAIYDKAINNLEDQILQLPWSNKTFYCEFLAQTYYFVCHSTRLLAAAASRLGVNQDQYHKRFVKHISEEKNHEKLALADLKQLNEKIEDFDESPLTKAFYECQYYKIEHQDPMALMGYILVLEGASIEIYPKVYPLIAQHHSEKATKFLKLHIEEDVDHVDKAFAQIENINSPQVELIKSNINQSQQMYTKFLLDCRDQAIVKQRFQSNQIARPREFQQDNQI